MKIRILIFISFLLLITLAFLSSYSLPKIIWLYWDTPERPTLVQQIYDYNKDKLRGWDVRFLNKTDLPKYISDSDYPKNYSLLSTPHQADWIRLYLLKHYGGCWTDASIIFNDFSVMDRLYTQSVSIRSQLTGFSFKRTHLYIENWFIMAPKNSSVISLWFQEYTKAVEMGFMNYKHRLFDLGVNLSKIYKRHTDDVYLTQHACIQYVLQKQFLFTPPMIILPAEDAMLKIRQECNYDCKCTMNTIRDKPEEARRLPFIKLVGCDRDTGIDISRYFSIS